MGQLSIDPFGGKKTWRKKICRLFHPGRKVEHRILQLICQKQLSFYRTCDLVSSTTKSYLAGITCFFSTTHSSGTRRQLRGYLLLICKFQRVWTGISRTIYLFLSFRRHSKKEKMFRGCAYSGSLSKTTKKRYYVPVIYCGRLPRKKYPSSGHHAEQRDAGSREQLFF